MMKKLFFIPLVALAGALGAQTTEATSATEATDVGVLQKLKDSPFGFKFVSDTYTAVVKGNDLVSRNRFYFDYNLTDNDTLTSETRVYHQINPSRGLDYVHINRTVLRYKRSNILTPENDGVDLSAYVGRRQYVHGPVRKKANQYGHMEFGLEMSKRIGNWSFVLNPEYNYMDRVSNTPDTTRDLYYLFAMGTYTFTNKWGVSLWSEIIHENKINPNLPGTLNPDRANNDPTMVVVVPQIDYTIVPGTTASLYFAGLPFQNSDGGQFIRDGWERDNTIGIYFQSRVF